MALSRADFAAIGRHLQRQVRELDPEADALALEYSEPSDDPRAFLLQYLRTLIKVVSERSSGAHGRVLNLLNRHIRTDEGQPIRGIRLELSPVERELFQRDTVDLASLPDQESFVRELLALYDDLTHEEIVDRRNDSTAGDHSN